MSLYRFRLSLAEFYRIITLTYIFIDRLNESFYNTEILNYFVIHFRHETMHI
jgi:hypothetical protein